MTLTEFLLARIAEDEAAANVAHRESPARVLAECEAKRRIVEFHKSWPVLVQTPVTFEPVDGTDPGHYTFRATQQIAWTTEQEYRERFGDEPPAGPVLRHLAAVYADHPDYREEWRP